MKGPPKKLSLDFHRIARYFDFFMVIVYVVLGIIIIVSSDSEFFSMLNPLARMIFGSLLVVYGIFRAYRSYKRFNHEEPA